jgi:hypothetical protein
MRACTKKRFGQNLDAGFSHQDLLFRLYRFRSAFLNDIAINLTDHPWLDNAIIRRLGRGDKDMDTRRSIVPIGRLLLGNIPRALKKSQ